MTVQSVEFDPADMPGAQAVAALRGLLDLTADGGSVRLPDGTVISKEVRFEIDTPGDDTEQGDRPGSFSADATAREALRILAYRRGDADLIEAVDTDSREKLSMTVGELRDFLADLPEDARVRLNVSGRVAPAYGYVASSGRRVAIITA